jgi:hypothetical protein
VSVRVVVRYDKEGRLSSLEVSGDPAAVHQVLSQLLPLNQAQHGPAPSQQEPPAPERAEPKRGRRARASAQQAEEGLPDFVRDNPWLPLLASRAKQS